MRYIDEKFKDRDPKATVEKIRGILSNIGVEVVEKWNDSGVENCYSLSVHPEGGTPNSNGKGITRDFARASAYAEFIERLQAGLFTYKYQSINHQQGLNIHTYAPDVQYMTMAEIIEKGEWMDYLTNAYGPEISREVIAEHCKAYACTDEDRIPTVPFYSLFEEKYVWLPAGFVEQMYTANGCCAGNSREEAWVHALSEIMERHCALRVLTSGEAAPRLSEAVLNQFPAVSSILATIRASGNYDVDVFDYSLDDRFPVISTRIISKLTHSYRVSVAADPVLEIAIQRSLTELFQGETLETVTGVHNGQILGKVTDFSLTSNVINQVESASGLFTADFFANEITCQRESKAFVDNSGKNNKELLAYMLNLYRDMGKQVYVRNLSYLGFHSYKFVVPGFSETREVWLKDIIPEYVIAEDAAKAMRNPCAASDEDLTWMLVHSKSIMGQNGRYMHFNRLSGVPLSGSLNSLLIGMTRAYAAYRLKQYDEAIHYLNTAMKSRSLSETDRKYFICVNKYLELKKTKIADDKIRSILYKFFMSEDADRLYAKLDCGQTPFDEYLLCCDYESCDSCKYQKQCSFRYIRSIYQKAGKVYGEFVDGQNPAEFAID